MVETTYGYDELGRLTSVDFDTDGDTTIEETVSYAYDISGNRTSLTFDGQTVAYEYDDKGRLTSMTDWDSNVTNFAYDNVNRHIATMRQDGFRSHYQYDAGGRLKRLRHHDGSQTLADFLYEVDARGNRTKATELLRQSGATMSTTTIAHDNTDVEYSGTWSAVGSFHETTAIGATLRFEFLGNTNVELTMGEGDDHSIYDVYVNETLWQSNDGYASASGERVIEIPLTNDGVNVLEFGNTMDVNSGSSGRKVRFKQLSVDSDVTMQVIDYSYDDIERLLEADYVGSTRNYKYSYDLAGNRVSETINNGTPTTYTYNNANQLTGDGTNTYSYDNNGNLTNDGANSYTWDRANRLLSRGSNSYAYNGDGQRISQTVSATVTDYLLDIQPGLEVVLRETTGSDVESFVYDNRGMVHTQEKANGSWRWMAEDGLGSIRSVMDNNASVVSSSNYAPYGSPFDVVGGGESPFGYTGEYTDGTGDVFLRARYYNPSMGTFNSLDPFEGYVDLPMSINGYGYVHGNPTNLTDPSGMFAQFLVGAFGGMAFGTILGFAQGTILYNMSVSGACGCEKQQQATQMGQGEFVRQTTAMGLLFGTVVGALATVPAGGMFMTILNIVDKVDIATKIGTIVDDFFSDGDIDDWCIVAELAFDIFTERLTNKLANSKPKQKRKINRDVDVPNNRRNRQRDIPNQRRNGQGNPNQRRQGCSFSPDTIVATQDGDKPIAKIEIGDIVMGYSEVAGAVSFMHVTATHSEHHETTLDVTIDGELVHTTDEHPFFVINDDEGEWVKAKDLQVGDVIFNTMGKDGIVEVVEVIAEPQTMYNLSVQLVASYFVSDGQWLVHNVTDNDIIGQMIRATQSSVDIFVDNATQAGRVFYQHFYFQNPNPNRFPGGFINTTGVAPDAVNKWYGRPSEIGTYHWDIDVDSENNFLRGHSNATSRHGRFRHLQIHDWNATKYRLMWGDELADPTLFKNEDILRLQVYEYDSEARGYYDRQGIQYDVCRR